LRPRAAAIHSAETNLGEDTSHIGPGIDPDAITREITRERMGEAIPVRREFRPGLDPDRRPPFGGTPLRCCRP
ncbi:MAG: hypothetical protein LC749_04075, partial [Actinobacteria bacterium]|nr:hypothetical protein [Actinomycetota bacterium]